MEDREKKIVKVSMQGIFMNVFLVAFKALVGFLANSIAIILDALNNLSDTFSAIVTIIGAKLSNKAPDKEHPYGHGRIEYFAAVVVSIVVIIAGIASLRESILKIFEPAELNYQWYTLLVIIIAIVAKYIFGKHAKKVGKDINSQSLVATGADAYMDAVLSFTTLVGAIINLTLGLNLEGYLGVLISIMIFKSAFGILKETIDSMIGQRPESEFSKELKQKINSYEGVHGTYDLMLHSYGPDKYIGSAHIAVSDSMTARDIHGLTRMIAEDLFDEYGIVFTISIYALNEGENISPIRQYVVDLIKEYPMIKSMHGFYINEQIKRMSFDLVFDFSCKNPEDIKAEIKKKLREKYPDIRTHVVIDIDVSD